MKNTFLFSILIIAIVGLASCKKKKTNTTNANSTTNSTETAADITVYLKNVIDSKKINFGVLEFANKAGNTYSVSELKYYISEISFTKDDGKIVSSTQVSLIDAADTKMQSFNIKQLPNGTYTKMKFYIGVGSLQNHSGLQEGALDPINGMFWTWNTGYIFFKHDGQFIDSTGVTKGVSFHLGTDVAYAKIEIPVNFGIIGKAKNVYLKFDLNKLYETPNLINFDFGNNHQSTSVNDSAWIAKMKQNFNHSFSFDYAE
jgi:hypothetical protein